MGRQGVKSLSVDCVVGPSAAKQAAEIMSCFVILSEAKNLSST